jgi:act minimal PKS acyl carrier protein
MSEFTLDDLREIMRISVGVEEGVDLDGPIAELEFTELGYDSLALAEVVSQVSRRYDVVIGEDEAFELTTPGAVVAVVNDRLARAAS